MIFTLLICCFLGLGALQPSCDAPRSNENNIVEVESKHRNDLVNRYGYIYISPFEAFGSTDFYSTFSDTFFQMTTTGSTYGMPYATYETRLFYWDSSDLSTPDYTYTNAFPIDSLYYELVFYGVSNNHAFQQWHIHFIFNNNTDYYYRVDLGYGSTTLSYDNLCLVNYMEMSGVQAYGLIIRNSSTSWWANKLISSEYQNGYNQGYINGYDTGESDGYDSGVSTGYDTGYTTGYNRGETDGFDDGYQHGISYAQDPRSTIYQSIYETGNQAGYQSGYASGLTDGQANSGVAQTIFAGCVEVGLLPVNVFLKMFEYEVFGINIAGFVSALMTIAIVIIIIRMVTGGKNDK